MTVISSSRQSGILRLVGGCGLTKTHYTEGIYGTQSAGHIQAPAKNQLRQVRVSYLSGFLNANGVDVRSYDSSGGFGSSSGGSNTDYTLSGSGSCNACGGVTTIQFQFAVDPYIEEMSYVLYDIPVPTF